MSVLLLCTFKAIIRQNTSQSAIIQQYWFLCSFYKRLFYNIFLQCYCYLNKWDTAKNLCLVVAYTSEFRNGSTFNSVNTQIIFLRSLFRQCFKIFADDSTCLARNKLRAMTSIYKMSKLDSFRSLDGGRLTPILVLLNVIFTSRCNTRVTAGREC